jgi:hypothetical protein
VKEFVLAAFIKCVKVEREMHGVMTRKKNPATFEQMKA